MEIASPRSGKDRLILCFSSHDADGKAEIEKQLAALLRTSALKLWSTDDIPLGAPRTAAFSEAVAQACAAVLLLSADFLADRQLEAQLAELQEQHSRRGLRLIPIIWRACSWKSVDWLAPLMPAPRDGSPLKSMEKPRREQELVTIVSQLALPPGKPSRPHPAVDPALASRAYGFGVPLLDCDRGAQWESLRALVRNDHHELIFLPGAAGQAHRFFLDRIELALPQDPPRRVIRVDWEAPRDLAVPQFRQNRREALAALARALDLETDSEDDLAKVLHAQLEEHHIVLLHPVVNRCLGEAALLHYYSAWLPALLGNSKTTYRCKVVQPIEWTSAGGGLLGSLRERLARGPARAVRADQKQASDFMNAVKKQLADEAKKSQQPPILRVTKLTDLAQLQKHDVVTFLEVIHYADDQPDPDASRSALAEHVLDGDASSEQVLQRLCRELPRDLWPSGAP